jgi:signal transduction histidine kinase
LVIARFSILIAHYYCTLSHAFRGLLHIPELLKHIEGIDLAVKQSEEIFEFNRLYEKIGLEQLSEIDVAESFEEAIKLHTGANKVSFINDCEKLQVMADSMLRQLFYNLIDNSLKHGKKISLIKLCCQQKPDRTTIIYEDNGAGISEENKNKIFTGYTTGGTGLGLKLVKKMIEAYGWTIIENGEPQKGARFEITIPNAH